MDCINSLPCPLTSSWVQPMGMGKREEKEIRVLTKKLSLAKLESGSSESSSQLGLNLWPSMVIFASLSFGKNSTKSVYENPHPGYLITLHM